MVSIDEYQNQRKYNIQHWCDKYLYSLSENYLQYCYIVEVSEPLNMPIPGDIDVLHSVTYKVWECVN